MKINDLLLGLLCFAGGHFLTFFQLNGQFLETNWFRKNEFGVAVAGVAISYFYMYGTKFTVSGMEGLLWPARFIGFGIGMILYAFMVSYFFNQGITFKTLVSLILCVSLISIQVFWK